MDKKEYTAEQLADRWLDLREIQNLVGRYAYDELFKRQGTMYATYWTRKCEPEYITNAGCYKGADAVKGYFAAYAQNTEIASAHIQKLFPSYWRHSILLVCFLHNRQQGLLKQHTVHKQRN